MLVGVDIVDSLFYFGYGELENWLVVFKKIYNNIEFVIILFGYGE